MRFALALHSDNKQSYGVTVPDLPGCFSAGDSLDSAVENAREAIDGHCEALAESGADIPTPQPLAIHQHRRQYADAIWVLVDVDISAYLGHAEKINITVPARILHRIDRYVRTRGLSRSGFLTQAAVSAMTPPTRSTPRGNGRRSKA